MERLVLVPFKKPPFHLESSLKIIADVPDAKIVYVESKNEEEWIKNLKDIEVAFPSGAFTKGIILPETTIGFFIAQHIGD